MHNFLKKKIQLGKTKDLLMDNLNTHTKGAYYRVFEPAVARAYVNRIDFVGDGRRLGQTKFLRSKK